MTQTSQYLWEDKYEPKTLASYIFQNETIKAKVHEIVSSGVLPSLLISGVQGTGKTTLAKVLIHEFSIERMDTLIINASRESGVDIVRERITDFCRTFPIGKLKVVLLEEADGLSPAAQQSLRATIDEYKKTVRFIFTCNYESKIIAPLKSRFREIRVNAFSADELLNRAADILEQEKVTVDDVALIEQHVNLFSPDLRKITVSLQQASYGGKLHAPETSAGGSPEAIDKWISMWESGTLILGDAIETVKYGGIDSTNYERFYRSMYENVKRVKNGKHDEAVVNIAEHLFKASFVADQEINMVACLLKVFPS